MIQGREGQTEDRSPLKQTLFWGLTLIIPLLVVELVLRLYFATQLGEGAMFYGITSSRDQRRIDPVGYIARTNDDNHTVMHHYNKANGYEKFFPYQQPVDHNEHGEVFSVTINGRGFRGKDFTPAKKRGTLRIATLGASSTFGFHDKDNETYPAYLQDSLTAGLRANGCTPFTSVEVINLGIPGLTSEKILALFFAEALPLNPDVVTLYEGYNDAHRAQKAAGSVALAKGALKQVFGFNEFYNALREKSITIAMIANLNATLAMTYTAEEVSDYINGRPAEFISNVAAIYDECMKRNILFVVANQQMKSFIVDREKIDGVTYEAEVALVRNKLASGETIGMFEREMLAHEPIMNALQSWSLQQNVPFVNIIEALNRNRGQLVSYVHISGKGNMLIASAFSNAIFTLVCKQQKSLPPMMAEGRSPASRTAN